MRKQTITLPLYGVYSKLHELMFSMKIQKIEGFVEFTRSEEVVLIAFDGKPIKPLAINHITNQIYDPNKPEQIEYIEMQAGPNNTFRFLFLQTEKINPQNLKEFVFDGKNIET